MGIECYLKQITPEWFAEIQQKPHLATAIIQAEPSKFEGMFPSSSQLPPELAQRPEFASALQALSETKRNAREKLKQSQVFEQGNVPALDLHKDWERLLFFITGRDLRGHNWASPSVLGKAIVSGTQLHGAEETGYGLPMYLTPTEVQEVAAALSALYVNVLTARATSEEAMIISERNQYYFEDEEEIENCQFLFEQLSEYYSKAANAGNAMLIWFT